MTKRSELLYGGFWTRAIAAIIDMIVLAILLSAFVSYVAVAKKIPLAFLGLHPGEPPSEVVSAFGKPP